MFEETNPAPGLIAEFDELIQDVATLSKAAELLAMKIARKREDLSRMLADLKSHSNHASAANSVLDGMIGYIEAGLPVEAEGEQQAKAA